jgi:hypothetical protein
MIAGRSSSSHHNATMECYRRAMIGERRPSRAGRDNLSQANKLSRTYAAAIAGLIGIAPQDEIEGMIAAQLIATHNASMECYRRAMIGEQTLEGRRDNFSQANKLSRTYAVLLDALNRYRGKGGQQKVSARRRSGGGRGGGEPGGRGIGRFQRINPMQNKLPMHLSRRCGARTRSGSPCRSAAMPNGRCRMQDVPGRPEG